MLQKVCAIVSIVVLSIVALPSLGQQAALVAVPLPDAVMAAASEVLREEVAVAMEQAARSFGLVLDTGDLVYACRDDFVVASAGAAGFEDADSSVAGSSTALGLVYFSREVEVRFGDGVRGKRPAGFYAVRVSTEQSSRAHDPGITLLELVGIADTEIVTLPTELLAATPERRLTLCMRHDLTEGEDTVCFGWFGRLLSASFCVVAT